MERYIEKIVSKKGIQDFFTQSELEVYDHLVMEVDTDINMETVILSEENRTKLKDFMEEQIHRKELIKYGLHPMNRLLFYGASGTGKTLLAKALCNQMGYVMLYVDIAKSLSEGNVSVNISNIFKLANCLGECLIFFDECDSIAWNRDSVNPETGTIRRALNGLFQSLDQMQPGNIFIGATNMLHRLDIAFERRFDMKFEFRRPGDIDTAIKHFIYKEFSLTDDIGKDWRDIIKRRAEASPKLSYYEIQTIVKRAMKKAVIRGETEVKLSDIYNDLAKAERIRMYHQ